MSPQYQCILYTALFRDDEVIAQIHSDQERVVKLRNKIRSTLMHSTLLEKHGEYETITSQEVADHIFKVLDEDGGGGSRFVDCLGAHMPHCQ